MFTTQNMLLTAWDSDEDDFIPSQLENNWVSVDQHDHSFGKGVQISTGGIAAHAITTGLMAAGSVTNAQIAAGAVQTSNIANQAITNALIAPGAITGNVISPGAITAAALDSTLIPLGQVSLWWRPSGSGAVPGGFWEIMDGRPWNAISNAFGLSTGNIPDMRGLFARGADVNGSVAPGIGTPSGSNTANLAHSHNVISHSHSIPAHAHGISADGSHMHLWQNGLHMSTRTNTFALGINVKDAFSSQIFSNTFYSMYINGLLSNPNWLNGSQQTLDGVADMDNAGSHSHGGATASSGTLTSGATTTTTDSQLGSTSVIPSSVSLLYIMRCR